MRVLPGRLYPVALLLGVGASAPPQAMPDGPSVPPHERGASPRRMFVSGHSLSARPFPDYVAAIAAATGSRLEWNMQHLFGSSLLERTQGRRGAPSGYREGVDRDGGPVDVLHELRRHGADAYDALLLVERHTLLESLVWNDTVGSVLDYEARFRLASPNGRTYFFSSWINLARRDDTVRWIAYERAAAPAWQCTTDQINRSLAEQGARTQVTLIPAAEGLAALVAHATKMGLGPVGANRPDEIIRLLFSDDVHLTPAGTYYVALLTHGMMQGPLPAAVWAPSEVDPAIASALLLRATAFLGQRSAGTSRRSEVACRRYVADFVPHYLSYVRDVKWREEGTVKSRLKWLRFRMSWPHLFRSDTQANPLRVRRS